MLIAGLVFCSSALLFLVIGFSTPHWLELDTNYITNSGFEKLGLWEACFNNFAYYKDYTGKIYNGCWWIFSYEYRPIWNYINPRKSKYISSFVLFIVYLQITHVHVDCLHARHFRYLQGFEYLYLCVIRVTKKGVISRNIFTLLYCPNI